MPHDQPQALSLHVEPSDAKPDGWTWTIYRDPDRMLIVRSLPDYETRQKALSAGSIAAFEIGRKLRLPIAGTP